MAMNSLKASPVVDFFGATYTFDGCRRTTEVMVKFLPESVRTGLKAIAPMERYNHLGEKRQIFWKPSVWLIDTPHNIPEEVPFNLEAYADVVLIDDEEYPEHLEYEDAAGYDIEIERNLSKGVYQEAGYLEEKGSMSDEARYWAASIASVNDYEVL
ncbi:hypothetical protein BDV36DRAFT_292047 [Aspergillus pseudocaelatus]|uniref:EthD domain-containing protein n=1 Tax=Aspergillus pseudocaelatus TaxID=1825620 RepID=A0ABQ6WX28_9EURO|nr:hypothetical protein BDV36DRAFT_292047 [Aspergillus pseudocaelatus]